MEENECADETAPLNHRVTSDTAAGEKLVAVPQPRQLVGGHKVHSKDSALRLSITLYQRLCK